MKIPLFLFLLSIALPLMAENKMYVIGGGGEPTNKDTTIFDNQLSNLSDYSKKSKYSSDIYFNGGHDKTEAIRNGFAKANTKSDFSKAAFDEFLKKTADDISNKKVKDGEQVLIYIGAHGDKSRDGEQAHKIAGRGAISSVSDFKGSESIDLAKLQDIITLAEKNNVKLAIVDASCFSGNTLKLKTEKTCIMSATGTDHFSYASNPMKNDAELKTLDGFGNAFTRNLSNKKFSNLEDAFLYSRVNSAGADFPVINTPEGMAAQKILYGGISEYLNIEAENINMLKDLFTQLESPVALCRFDNAFNSTVNMLNRLANQVSSAIKKDPLSLKKLRDYLKTYHSLLSNQAQANLLLKTNSFPDVTVKDGSRVMKYTMRNFLAITPEKKIASLLESKKQELLDLEKKGQLQEYKEIKEEEYGSEISYYRKVAEEQKKLIASDPKIKKIYEGIQNWNKDEDKNAALAFKIAHEARKVYQDLYKASTPKPNPCNQFKL